MPTLTEQQIDELAELYEQRDESAVTWNLFSMKVALRLPALLEMLVEKDAERKQLQQANERVVELEVLVKEMQQEAVDDEERTTAAIRRLS